MSVAWARVAELRLQPSRKSRRGRGVKVKIHSNIHNTEKHPRGGKG